MINDSRMTVIRQEILQVADMVAREKGIEREQVFEALEQAIQKAARSKYGFEHDIRAFINRNTGEISLHRYREVAEVIENDVTQLTLEEALVEKPDAKIGDFLVDSLPPIDFGRVAAQTAKQVIIQKVRDAERDRQLKEYKDKIGEIINGTVKRVEFGNVTVDTGRAEALLRRDEIIPRESIRVGDRIRAVILDVRPETRGPQIFLSRTDPSFMAKLFTQEVPEIYDGLIEIKALARDPGSRAKMAVLARDPSIDPVGSCVGIRGSRVQAVVQECQGEKVDIIPWSDNMATFIVNALAPAEVSKVVLDEETNRIEVVVPEDQQSLAIGRRGQNVRLASILTGCDIDILTESMEAERRQEEFRLRSALFKEALDVDEMITQLLVAEGFASVEEIAYVDLTELTSIDGFEEELAVELQNRARTFLVAQEEKNKALIKKLGISKELQEVDGLTLAMLVALGENKVKTLDDFADLAGDELVEMLRGSKLTLDQANDMIMSARAHWFEEDNQ